MLCGGVKKNQDLQVLIEHASHKTRLSAVKGRLNMASPKQMPHLQSKLKAKALKKDSDLQIQTENSLLLNKMLKINTRSHDNRPLSESFSSKSLNANLRTQQISKISEENSQFLTRLHSVRSNYSCKLWDKDYQYKCYLSMKLSENSRRVPKTQFFSSFDSARPYSRPRTAINRLKRPNSSKPSKYLDY